MRKGCERVLFKKGGSMSSSAILSLIEGSGFHVARPVARQRGREIFGYTAQQGCQGNASVVLVRGDLPPREIAESLGGFYPSPEDVLIAQEENE